MDLRIVLILVLSISALSDAGNNGKDKDSDKGRHRRRQISAMDEDIYNTLYALVKGTFNVPVKERSCKQKTACVRFWRNRDKLEIRKVGGEERLFFNGKQIMKKVELKSVVEKEFRDCKGAGARKLNRRLKIRYEGVSEPQLQNILSKSKINQRTNCRFTNKAIARPVRAKSVQMRHQVDLVEMKRTPAEVDGVIYRYILTVQDIFSRYLWLRPLRRKRSKDVSKELQDLYYDVGPPRVLQCDNGGEFKSAVERLCRKLQVKITRSSPYHPQSQGKVERSHRSLRKKIMFDLLKMSKVGVNWVEQLGQYQKILNEDIKDVLGQQSPFEVFYGRASNAVTQRVIGGVCLKETALSKTKNTNPRNSDFKTSSRHSKTIRRRAKVANAIWDKRYIKRKVKNNPPSTYLVGEKVLIRFPFAKTSGISLKRRFVVTGKITARNLPYLKYKILFRNPMTKKGECRWTSVENITSLTYKKEKKRQNQAKRQQKKKYSGSKSKQAKNSGSKSKQSFKHKTYYIALQRGDHYEAFNNQGYDVDFNPAGDGNCQFSAVSHALREIGIYRDHATIRRDVVEYLEENPNAVDGFPLELYTGVPWSDYLSEMSEDGTYGDHMTLQAMADLYLVRIVIISTIGPDATTVISPQTAEPIGEFHMGHFSEQCGIHYVSLVPALEPDNVDSPDNTASNQQINAEANNIETSNRSYSKDKNQQINREANSEKTSKRSISSQDNEQQANIIETSNKPTDSEDNDQQIHREANSEETSNRLQNNDQQVNGVETPKETLDNLSDDILDMIFIFALTGEDRTVVDTYNSLKDTNCRFRGIIKRQRYIRRLPQVSFSRNAFAGVRSMRSVVKEFGRGSGLVLTLKDIINSPRWINAWVNLIFTGVHTWMYVTAIIWKSAKKR